MCALIGTSMAISKVCAFGWRLCRSFGNIAWNKYGVWWVVVLLLVNFLSKKGKWFSELEGSLVRMLKGDKTDSALLYEMVGWLILASGREVAKFLLSNIPVRATTVKDPTHRWWGSLVRGTPPLDPNPNGLVLGPGGEGESPMIVGPLCAMSPMQVETPSSPQ